MHMSMHMSIHVLLWLAECRWHNANAWCHHHADAVRAGTPVSFHMPMYMSIQTCIHLILHLSRLTYPDGMCIDMCTDMCIDTCIDMCMDMRVDMLYRHVYRHLYRHVCRHVY